MRKSQKKKKNSITLDQDKVFFYFQHTFFTIIVVLTILIDIYATCHSHAQTHRCVIDCMQIFFFAFLQPKNTRSTNLYIVNPSFFSHFFLLNKFLNYYQMCCSHYVPRFFYLNLLLTPKMLSAPLTIYYKKSCNKFFKN